MPSTLNIPIIFQTFKIAKLNINATSSNTRLQMLEDFLRRQDINFAFLQVSHTTLNTIRRYTVHMNIATDRRGTAILDKEGLALSNIQRIPSGRGISASFRGILVVNIYGRSGAEKMHQREAFYNTDVVHLIPSSSTAMMLAGDVNCVITNDDCPGQRSYSRALAKLIKGLDLIDVWQATPTRNAYTHYTATGASRIDRIYVTHDLPWRQQDAETVATAFTDHFAVIPRFTMDVPCSPRGKGYWLMNVSFLSDPSFLQTKKEN